MFVRVCVCACRFVNKLVPRGIYTSGKGSSAVGLTAYVTKGVLFDVCCAVLGAIAVCGLSAYADSETTEMAHLN